MIIFFFIIFFINLLFLFKYNFLSKIIKIYDIPDNKRKVHSNPIPLLGGTLIYFNLAIFFFCNYFFDLNLYFFESFINEFIFFTALTLFFLIGIIDDKISLSPNLKLFLISLIITMILIIDESLIINTLSFSFYQKEINLGYFSYFFTILCFLLFVNAFNMLDGINGQSVSYLIFILLVFIFNKINILLVISLFIPVITFLILNFRNKIFLGDSGSLSLGFFISYLFIDHYNLTKFIYCDEIFLVMIIPGFELLRLAIFRIINKKHPFKGDSNHIHHLLLKKNNFITTFLFVQLLLISPYVIYNLLNNGILSIIISIIFYSLIIYRQSIIKKK